NGRDFYVILGRAEPGDPRRPIAHKYGFGNAGGGSWYWKPLRNLEPGHRVFAHVSAARYASRSATRPSLATATTCGSSQPTMWR
ncbi:MAG: hypothetical protein OXG91_02155, partial [bacterium]|nr:hypothetical protein [bacterium]